MDTLRDEMGRPAPSPAWDDDDFFREPEHPAIPPRQFRDLMYAEIQWRDRDGNIWNISEMADDHLENAMRMMIRQADDIYMREVGNELDWADRTGANMPDDVVIGLAEMKPWRYVIQHYPPYRAMAEVRRKRKHDDLDALRRSREHHKNWLEDYERHDEETVKDLVLFVMSYDGPMDDQALEQKFREILGMEPGEVDPDR